MSVLFRHAVDSLTTAIAQKYGINKVLKRTYSKECVAGEQRQNTGPSY